MRFKKVPTITYLCLMPLLISLGFWQLGRSEEKKIILEKQNQAFVSSEVLMLSSLGDYDIKLIRYMKAQVVGSYDSAHQFLLDNQIKGGKVGYFVLTPFIFENKSQAILVNRGWVPLNQNRNILPDISIKNQQSVINGRINQFPSVGIKLAGAEIPTEGWPSVLQVIDAQILTKKMGYTLLPFQIELDQNLPEGFIRDWQKTTVMLPEQHIAYAIQWFSLALTLSILFIWYSNKKSDE